MVCCLRKKLVSSGPSKNRTETTRRGVNAPEDQQLEPDDDGLENDFSSSRNFIVRFHVNLSGCTPLIPFANETRKISAFLLSTEAGPQSDCEFWRQVHQRTAAASLIRHQNRGSVFPDLSCDQQKHQVWCHKFVVLDKTLAPIHSLFSGGR